MPPVGAMRPVGIAGRRTGSRKKNPTKAAEYRHSDAGRQARKLRNQNPEIHARTKARRDAHRHLGTGGN